LKNNPELYQEIENLVYQEVGLKKPQKTTEEAAASKETKAAKK